MQEGHDYPVATEQKGRTPRAEEVIAQLERVLEAPSFAQSARLQKFLRYIVEETLAGRGASLKEYTLALEVFERPESFDPQTSSLVRVEASRLRAKLKQYAAGEGRGDPVRITLPAGRYVPEFETTARVQRRLAAILAADVVGYSRLIEADEESVRARLRSLRAEVTDPRFAVDGGRIVKTMGDGLLVEFPSAVNAVRSALAIQGAMGRRNADLAKQDRIEFRVGINVGDVIVEDDDIHGDGVIVASRLEGLCEPREVYVSGTVYDQTSGKLAASFDDLGERTVKNIKKPVRVYRAYAEANWEAESRTLLSDKPSLPDKPSIAILPFQNMSGDPEQEYFVDGLAEDIITSLSKFHWFLVIARNSSFTYKGSAIDVKQVARDLGVKYVVEGSVRKAGNRVRITAQLIDAMTDSHIWAERYDRDLEDIFAVQDELTEAIVGAVAPSFITAEARRLERKPPESFDAWDYATRGNWHLSRLNKHDVGEAKRLFEKALELDPNSTMALSGLAFVFGYSINFGWVEDFDEARRLGNDAARRAVDLNEGDAGSHFAVAIICFYMYELDAAIAACRRAVELNPNLAAAEGWLAVMLSWRGDYEEALAHAGIATRLSPRDTYSMCSLAQTAANFGAGNYEQAISWAKKAIEASPEFPPLWRYLTASLAHLDRMEEALAARDQLLRIMPNESLQLVRAALPSANPDRMGRIIEGLRKAGVQE